MECILTASWLAILPHPRDEGSALRTRIGWFESNMGYHSHGGLDGEVSACKALLGRFDSGAVLQVLVVAEKRLDIECSSAGHGAGEGGLSPDPTGPFPKGSSGHEADCCEPTG